MDLRVGGIYMVRGGHILRYQGPWGGKGPCLAFRPPTHGVSEPPVGYSAAEVDVLYEVTAKDLPWLLDRREALKARSLSTEDINRVIDEVGKGNQ